MNEFLFVVVPYVCLTVFVVGHLWRYRYDKFGWTTRSSQLYENRLLRIGSPLFHFGMLGVVGGHVIGLLVPQSWTDALGISEHTYHVVAVAGGLLAGAMTVVGMAILIYRRRTTGPVFSATTTMDKVMYAVLGVVIVLGMWNTIAGSILTIGGEYNYREGVSVWYRSFLAFQPDADLMAEAPAGLPAPRPGGVRAVRPVALHAPGARVQRPPRLPHPSLHRLPQPRRRGARQPPAAPRLGPGRLRSEWPTAPRVPKNRREHAEGVTDRAGPAPPGDGRDGNERAKRPHGVRRARARAAPDPDRPPGRQTPRRAREPGLVTVVVPRSRRTSDPTHFRNKASCCDAVLRAPYRICIEGDYSIEVKRNDRIQNRLETVRCAYKFHGLSCSRFDLGEQNPAVKRPFVKLASLWRRPQSCVTLRYRADEYAVPLRVTFPRSMAEPVHR